ncbi:hypothetical protein [Streptomyces sp. VRA16 Mangrove soil]|uniref:hypothetical protein n=1 Tax=Streptomyces sp. VRA16 Mangrove soil TaxID=2817434 RepID=UPI001A9F5C40|nr:hypothetical protein [Streptomyces sp. VRA16 Mangrove soil]MBO1329922.1 hypothetical protein [Streptomyces sp. VRA16 Mangrove soil]
MTETTAQEDLTSQYADKISSDLAENERARRSISDDIAALQERLAVLEGNQALLLRMRESLGPAGATAPEDTVSTPAAAAEAPSETAKPTRARRTTGAKETSAKKKPASSRGDTRPQGPSLVDLLKQQLRGYDEPRSAAEITDDLGKAHPERSFQTKVVRNTLEALVAKSGAERTRQKRSVYYCAPKAEQPAA